MAALAFATISMARDDYFILDKSIGLTVISLKSVATLPAARAGRAMADAYRPRATCHAGDECLVEICPAAASRQPTQPQPSAISLSR